MADGRHFENRKYGRGNSDLHQILHGNIEIGTNLNFSQKLRKYENPRWWMAAILKIDNAQ